jgi:hypothetical protein
MGMPSIIVAFKEKGIAAIERSQRGIVCLILKETALTNLTQKTYNVYTVDDIPVGLSDDNKEQVKLALMGYQTAPKKVIVVPMLSSATDYNDIFNMLENIRFDYLVIPEISEADVTTVSTWIKGMRETKDVKVKAVLPNCKGDYEGVVDFTTSDIVTSGKTYTAAQYCSRIAGIICGTPAKISCTYAPLPEVVSVPAFTKEEMDNKVDAGELFLFFDGEKVKISRGINSLVTTIEGKGEEFQKVKLVDLMDMIHDDIKKTAQDNYLGKYSNSYDNRCLLVTAINGYFLQLEQEGLLEKGQNECYIDVEATKAWLMSNGLYTKDELAEMKSVDVKKANIHDNVFLAADISMLDTMEKIRLNIAV